MTTEPIKSKSQTKLVLIRFLNIPLFRELCCAESDSNFSLSVDLIFDSFVNCTLSINLVRVEEKTDRMTWS